jgi:hypothetical protein
MNERQQFLRQTSETITRTVQRIETMTEIEVLRALHGIKAKRESDARMLAFLSSVSLSPTEDLEDGINELRSQLNARKRSCEDLPDLSSYVEDALQKRLKKLREKSQ